MNFLKKYNEEITSILLLFGLFLYALGLHDKKGTPSPQIFFYLGGIIFFIYNRKYFSLREDFKNLLIPLICMLILILLGITTIFDTIMPIKTLNLLKDIRSHIFNYFILLFIFYFFIRYIRSKFLFYFFIFFGFLLLLNTSAMIFLGLKNGLYHVSFHQNIPFFFKAIFTYNIWIIIPIALTLSGLVIFKKLRILFFILFACSIFALFANGERSFFVAFLVMVLAVFIFCKYKYKIQILLVLFLLSFPASYAIYDYSKNLPQRYNISNMIDNFLVVVSTPVIEMGKYDEFCFNGVLECDYESIKEGKSLITWEHSSLSRIAMGKSTLAAFLDRPFNATTMNTFGIGEYLYKYYEKNDSKNKAYASVKPNLNLYIHPHNFIFSLLFSYGIFGFSAIAFLFINIMQKAYYLHLKHNSIYIRFIALSLFLCFIGILFQSLFDAIYPVILRIIFVLFGIVFGLYYRKETI